MTRKRLLSASISALLATGIALGYFVGRARASGIPATNAMTYSGVLTDTAGAPLIGSKTVEVQIWDALTGGTSACDVTAPPQTLSAGGFSVQLSDACTAKVHATQDLWVQVLVEGTKVGGRTKLGAVPYAVEADHADRATTATNATHATNADHVAVVTAWKADPNVTLIGYSDAATVNPQTTTSNWRRVGDSIEVNITTLFTGAPTTGSGAMAWSLPPGVKEDGSKMDRVKNGPIGHGEAYFGPGNVPMCQPYMAGDLIHILLDCGGSYISVGSAIGPGSSMAFRISLPVVGWSD